MDIVCLESPDQQCKSFPSEGQDQNFSSALENFSTKVNPQRKAESNKLFIQTLTRIWRIWISWLKLGATLNQD